MERPRFSTVEQENILGVLPQCYTQKLTIKGPTFLYEALRQPDSMKKRERQRLDWLSIRKKGINEDKNHLLRGWLVRAVTFVCPGTNTGQRDRIGRRDGNWRQCGWTWPALQPSEEGEPEKGEKR